MNKLINDEPVPRVSSRRARIPRRSRHVPAGRRPPREPSLAAAAP